MEEDYSSMVADVNTMDILGYRTMKSKAREVYSTPITSLVLPDPGAKANEKLMTNYSMTARGDIKMTLAQKKYSTRQKGTQKYETDGADTV